ncbi:tail length tape measure protein [Mycobacterium phage Onyinye]|uniref:Tape measure protein n=1 Tax=Mycobacterium phage Onyinye TaxID=2686235 RepID=A0A6B9L9H2_9CAUD|nr:tail length tape measure protein [Mycobacterium phage Onyinye]QHB37443.1 tape measure protein [Mycobacterium phage Onyinye]
MPDYDLGRARGHIEIDADTRGVDDARAAMRGASQSARDLDARLREVRDRYGENSEQARRASESVERHQVRIRNLQLEYGGLQQRLTAVRQVLRDNAAGTEEHTRARQEEADIVRRLIQVYGQYENTMRRARTQIGDFTNEVDRATRRTRDFRDQINDTDRTVRTLANSITSVLMPAMKSMMVLGAVGAGGGLLGLLGAGGAQGAIAVIAALGSAIAQLSGVVALLPAALGGAVAVMGTFAVAMRGVGDALGAAMENDPKKFAEAIKEMGPAAQSVVRTLASFTDAFKGAMREVQNSFFEPLVGVIEPLVRTWLPLLMNAGQQIARVLGEAGAQIAGWLQRVETISGFQEFITNLVAAMERLMPAFEPFANAFLTLMTVGSQFLPQISDALVRAANSFNDLVQGSAASGSLQRWIQSALDGFSDLWAAIKNIFVALGNLGELNGQGNFLSWLRDVTAQFRAWTESAEGTRAITTFFESISAAGQVLGPILRIVGTALLDVISNLAQVGVGAGGGFISFFQSLADALSILGQNLVASAPQISQILTVLGNTLVQIMEQIGPQLPGLFRDMADVITDLAPHIVTLATALAGLLANLTPTQIEVILGLVVAFQSLATVLPIIIGAIGGLSTIATVLGVSFGAATGIIAGVVVGIGLLVAAIIYCATHWEQVKGVLQSVWDAMKRFAAWIEEAFANAIRSIGDFFTQMWESLRNTVSTWWNEAYEWGRNIVSRFIDGIKDMFQPLSDAWNWLVGEGIDEKNPHSPPRKGPLSGSGDPLAAGQRVSERFATGIQQGAGSVSSAYDSVVGGGGQFSRRGGGADTGVNPNFGGGSNGMNAFVDSLTQDLQAFLSMIRSGFGVFEKIADIFVRTTTVVASLWNQGDNPLTRRGGIFSEDPGLTPEQQRIPGVENYEEPGKPPMPELTTQGNLPDDAPVVPQVNVPGVPSTTTRPAPATPAPPPPAAAPPRPGTPRANAPVPTPANLPTTGTLGNETYGRSDNVGQRTEAGFPQWVYDVAAAFGLGPSTYSGHQTGAAANQGHAPNPQGLNRGIDWWPIRDGKQYTDMSGQSYTPEEVARLQAFAEFLDRNGLAEQVIWRNPQTGQEVGYPHHADFSADYGGHEGHVHSRHSRSIQLPTAPAPADPGAGNRPAPGSDPLTDAGLYPPVSEPRRRRFDAEDFGGIDLQDNAQAPDPRREAIEGNRAARQGTTPQQRPSAPLLPITNFAVRGLGPGSVPYSGRRAPGTRGGATTTDEIQKAIIAEGKARGFSPDQITAALAIAKQETGFWSNRNTPTQGPAGVVAGVYQQSTTSGWGTSEQILDPAYAISRFYDVYGANIEANANMSPLQAAIITQNPSFYTAPRNYPYDRDTMASLPAAQEAWRQYGGTPAAPAPTTTPTRPPAQTPTPPTFGGPSAAPRPTTDDDWMLVPDGWDITQPIPSDIVARNLGITPEEAAGLPPMFYAARPDTVTNVYAPDHPEANTRGVISAPIPTQGGTPGFTETEQNLPFGAKTPIQAFQTAMGHASSIASDAFQVFDNVIKTIGATANLMDMAVRGPSSTEDVNAMIDNFQQYITLAASIAKLVSSTTGMAAGIAGAGGSDPTGGGAAAAGALSAVSAIAGIVQSALEATNMAIDLGQEVYHQVAKYGALLAGTILGGENGFLGGNVRMLLNTATGEVYSYSEDNPMQKTTHNLPDWFSRAYGGTRPELQPPRLAQVNIFAGPGQTPRDMMNESMWLVNNDAAAASVAGVD